MSDEKNDKAKEAERDDLGRFVTSKEDFKEKLRYWREKGSPISIPDNFRAR